MTDLKVIKKYDWGDYEEFLEETDLHCPNCGEQEVYVERSEGDYYVGPSYYCTSCRFQFTMPSSGKMSDKYRIEDI